MMRLPGPSLLMISVLFITAVLGCGVMPPGQANTRGFTVSGFSLHVSMVYSESTNVRSRYPGIAGSREAAKAFIERLMMQTVFDILGQQGRSALLPDAAITSILDQLKVRISYEPQECKTLLVSQFK
ncbi:hypothetical protein KIN20_032289 [Parelaphostrongylus tenuis]|uniref:Flagellar protein FliL n=1 Tax=Parelaphostrongylus tenuis TaxID=148309 RepID=A0AAD5R6R6_PARTN|nr:hypothetical protein KIN20_032289 [Parelaphostrongylus tenuis]